MHGTCRQAERQGVCTVEEDACDGVSKFCGTNSGGGSCFCFVTATGRSFCGAAPVGGTCGCTSNKQCQ